MSKLEENIMAMFVLAGMIIYYSIPVVGMLTFFAFVLGVL